MKKSPKISKTEAIYVMILLILILILLLFLLLRKLIQNLFNKQVKEYSLDEILAETKEIENSRTQKKTNLKASKKVKANTVITKVNSIMNKSALKANPKSIRPQENQKVLNETQQISKVEEKNNDAKTNSSFSVKNEKFKSIDLKDNENSKPEKNRSIYEIAESEIKLNSNSISSNLGLASFRIGRNNSNSFNEDEKSNSYVEKEITSAYLDNIRKNSFIEKSLLSEKESNSEYLTKEEIEAFSCLLGLLYYNIDVKRKYKIISVESIYELKLKNDCCAYKADNSFNSDFSKKMQYMETYENFIEIINLYCASIKKKILITLDNYQELIKCCIKVKEMNFAVFFLCEMEIKYGDIKKNIIDNIMENPELKLILCEKIVKNPRFKQSSNKKRKDSMNHPYANVNLFDSTIDLEKNLIFPLNNNFRQNPEYFFFKTKRENFRNQNLLNKLDILGLKLKEEEIMEEIKNKNNKLKEAFNNSTTKYNKEAACHINPVTYKNLNNNLLEKDEDHYNTDKLSVTDKIKMIIQGNVKEYMPRTFKIIIKENKND